MENAVFKIKLGKGEEIKKISRFHKKKKEGIFLVEEKNLFYVNEGKKKIKVIGPRIGIGG
ncbi:hypothetical protein [Lactobacillus gasseri]|uniref:hypothetical protein n=1 Tax=Lactobacillus gasseri TaxID=1596 RepID=UPI0023A99D0F|nr:hypothetical protein [Lactobacillus gasseri]WEA88818.1 hypothetical protein PUW43_02220 [Lactobacillus gasseri]